MSNSNQNIKPTPLENQQFISFNDQPSTEFNPANTSSPHQWNKRGQMNNYKHHGGGNRQSNYVERQFQKSYGSPQFGSPNKSSFNRSDSCSFNNSSFGSNPRDSMSDCSTRSFHSSFNKSQRHKSNSDFNLSQDDSSRYLHPSFMENPWEKLEKQLLFK